MDYQIRFENEQQKGCLILTQWDRDVRLSIQGIPPGFSEIEIHWGNKLTNEFLVVEPVIEGQIIYVNIPNILLQAPEDIIGYIYINTTTTVYRIDIGMQTRPKPQDVPTDPTVPFYPLGINDIDTSSAKAINSKAILKLLKGGDTGQSLKKKSNEDLDFEWSSDGTVDQRYDPESENAQSGVAVAEAVNPIKQCISSDLTENYGLNIINKVKSEYLDNTALDASGNENTNSAFHILQYIPVEPSTRYYFSKIGTTGTTRIHGYSEQKVWVKEETTLTPTQLGKSFVTSATTKYIRVSINKENSDLILSLGNSAIPYDDGFTGIDKRARDKISGLAKTNKMTEEIDNYAMDEDGVQNPNKNFHILVYRVNDGEKYTIRTSAIDTQYNLRIGILKTDDTYSQVEVILVPANKSVATIITVPSNGAYLMISARKPAQIDFEIHKVGDFNAVYPIDNALGFRTEFAAHRGARLEAPENSLPAFRLAGERGFEWLNLAQLRQSADGTWYIMHDSTIDRTTNGTGAIANLTDTYLSSVRIDVGPNIEQYSSDDLVIPTLEDAIKIAKQYGTKLYFRISNLTHNDYWGIDKSGWDSFISIIKKYRCENCIFGGNVLNDVLPLSRDLRLNWCLNYDVYSVADAIQQINNYVANGVKSATLFMPYTLITDEIIALARSYNYKIMVFDPNASEYSITKQDCIDLSNEGVDIISAPIRYDLTVN